MESRLAEVERGVQEIKAILGRLEPSIIQIVAQIPYLATKAELGRLEHSTSQIAAQIPYLATKAEVEASRGELTALLESKPNRAAMWAMGTALFGLCIAGLAAGAIWMPLIMKALRVPSGG
jgi:hypothetical protein